MSAKAEARQRAVEQKILQYKAVVDYLSGKTDVASIPTSNQLAIANVLIRGGWQNDGAAWVKGDLKLDLIQAGIKEFGDQYDRLKREHLRKTVKNFTEG